MSVLQWVYIFGLQKCTELIYASEILLVANNQTSTATYFYLLPPQRLCNRWHLSVCLFVSLFVNSVTQKSMHGFSSNVDTLFTYA